MWRRRGLVLPVLFTALTLAVLVFVWPRSHITQAYVAKIQVGMTEAEVEAILGGPAGNYARPPRRYGLFGPPLPTCGGGLHILKLAGTPGTVKTWEGEDYRVEVIFDADSRVSFAYGGKVVRGREPGIKLLLNDCRQWLGW
jgi:hypothetical protein